MDRNNVPFMPLHCSTHTKTCLWNVLVTKDTLLQKKEGRLVSQWTIFVCYLTLIQTTNQVPPAWFQGNVAIIVSNTVVLFNFMVLFFLSLWDRYVKLCLAFSIAISIHVVRIGEFSRFFVDMWSLGCMLPWEDENMSLIVCLQASYAFQKNILGSNFGLPLHNLKCHGL